MKTRVYNDNTHDYKNTFKGDPVHIPAGKYIEMDHSEAVQLKSTFLFAEFDGSGVQLPKSYSKLRLVEQGGEEVKPETFKCHATGKIFATNKEYLEHLMQNEKLMEAQKLANEDAENVQQDLRTGKRNNAKG